MASSFPTYDNRHNAVGAWFLGPHAENFPYLLEMFSIILKEQENARKEYFPEDHAFVTPEMQSTDLFQQNIEKLKETISQLAPMLAKHSVPFWNPRYQGHMLMDNSMPGIVGYIMTMLFNPNNVATEASPLTSVIEIEVGKELCEMVGFNINVSQKPVGWGHITCGGSIANLESMWAARNLKFYPLSLVLAMDKELDFIADSFCVKTCMGKEKLLKEFTTWELLNISPNDILNMPDKMYEQYSMTPAFLQSALTPYLIQTIGKDAPILEKRFGSSHLNDMVYMASETMHYSWPKAAAITGIGSNNVVGIRVDNSARVDVKDLRKRLDECLAAKRPVYAVVAIIGSTEQGACDPLGRIAKVRDEYRAKGLSFALHADGAWGTYFASMFRPWLGDPKDRSTFVPSLALKPSTQAALTSLKHCDSITVDPHKSGYIQYPAGGLLYRDERMRYLVKWTSPIIFRNETESIGVYGVEGSKPGAAPVSAWVSHRVIGLHAQGYGALLREAVFSCVKMYAHLVTMSTKDSDFIVTPMNMLPSEEHQGDVEAEKQFIRERILNVPNEDLVRDEKAMELVKNMGSDLAINAFAVNFRVNGKENEDVVEANNLNQRIFDRLSISSVNDKQNYRTCLTMFKNRLGLKGDQDLYTLVNVVMSPFPTQFNFTAQVASALQQVIEEEIAISKFRNTITPDRHGFVMQGTEMLYLVHLPMFNMANRRFQLIITATLPADVKQKYIEARKSEPRTVFTIANAKKEMLSKLLDAGSFEAVINKGVNPDDSSPFLENFKLENVRVIVKRPLDSKFLSPTFPGRTTPIFIYGIPVDLAVDHVLVAAPNVQFNADKVRLDVGDVELPFKEGPLVAHLINFPERAMQPFPENAAISRDSTFFFRPGAKFDVTITKDIEGRIVLAKGTLGLSDNVFVDTDMLNMEPVPGTDGHLLNQSIPAKKSKAARRRGWVDEIKSLH